MFNDDNEISNDESSSRTLGDTASIVFTSLGGNKIDGKVDTGATTSSMHADNIQLNNGSVSFCCPYLSDNTITMDLHGSQDVLSADGGNNERPMVKLDIRINGVELPGVAFNLNDRSEMDCPILIGQNIIKTGQFVIDLNNSEDDVDQASTVGESIEIISEAKSDRDKNILEAVKILKDNNVTIFELVEFLRTAPLYLRNGEDHESD